MWRPPGPIASLRPTMAGTAQRGTPRRTIPLIAGGASCRDLAAELDSRTRSGRLDEPALQVLYADALAWRRCCGGARARRWPVPYRRRPCSRAATARDTDPGSSRHARRLNPDVVRLALGLRRSTGQRSPVRVSAPPATASACLAARGRSTTVRATAGNVVLCGAFVSADLHIAGRRDPQPHDHQHELAVARAAAREPRRGARPRAAVVGEVRQR